MITPAKPPTESARQAELEAFDILDTLPEEMYDAITLLAAEICDTPIALVSIVDGERQWFKSKIGLDIAEGPRELAFCAHAVLEPDSLLIVPNAIKDERFFDNPYVTGDAEVRFYAGAPLVTKSGNALGTLCVIDRNPRELNPAQQRALEALSKQVMALLDLRWTVSELKRKQEGLETAMRQRETFIATVSHEIRTPLSAVIGYIDLLSDPNAEISGFERGQLLATVARQAGDVAELIEDLLVAAKAEAGTLRVQSVPVNLAAQTAQVLEGLDPVRVAGIRVDTQQCRATADPNRVRQVIRNLVTNAFRYGGPDVAVSVQRSGERCVLEVSDDGAGVPPGDEARIFEPFQRSSGGTTVAESVGLGLPISRLLTERMGGTLTYRRNDGRSVFALDLPLAPLEPAEHPFEGAAAVSSA
jgi:signal transduction histidine kinase